MSTIYSQRAIDEYRQWQCLTNAQSNSSRNAIGSLRRGKAIAYKSSAGCKEATNNSRASVYTKQSSRRTSFLIQLSRG